MSLPPQNAYKPSGYYAAVGGAGGAIEVPLRGDLNAASLHRTLSHVDTLLREPRPVVFDCQKLERFDPDVRQQLIRWLSGATSLTCLAVITSDQRFRVVVGSLGLASGRHVRAFNHRETALGWAGVMHSRALTTPDGRYRAS